MQTKVHRYATVNLQKSALLFRVLLYTKWYPTLYTIERVYLPLFGGLMKNLAVHPFLFAFALAFVALPAFTQNTTTGQIRGIITDPSGAGVPSAEIAAKDSSTGITRSVRSNTSGDFTLLDLQSGKYQLTVTIAGFEKAIVENVIVDTGRVTNQPVQLVIGSVSNTVEISGATPVLETSSSQVATTIKNDFIQDLPLSGRDTLPFATLMAGNQSIGNSDNGRSGTFNGLPNASMNISLDGMNNNSQRFKSGGTSFFQFAPTRLDAIEEVTVATTGNGADAAGDGAMQIKLVTRRGTDVYHGKAFEQMRNEALNANSFFNNIQGLPRTKIRQNDFGGNFGGRLVPWVPYLRNRLFFFVNFEATPIPQSQISTATMLTPQAAAGNYQYVGTDNQVHTLNLLQFAAGGGFSGTPNPIVQGVLNSIGATATKGVVIPSSNLYQQTLNWNQPLTNKTYYPTTRVDYQISPNVAWHGVWNLRYNTITGVPQYPGLDFLGGSYKISAYIASNTVDWTIKPNLLNSFTFGVQSNGEFFYKGTGVDNWKAYNNTYYNLGLGVTPLIPNQTPFIRNNPVFQVSDNLSWLKGRHTLSFGGSWLHTSFWEETWNAPGGGGVLTETLGVDASDPINALFTQARINAAPSQAIRATDVASAAQLYATLTGRISSINGGLNVDEVSHAYTPYAPIVQRFDETYGGIFVQDTFRVNSRFTLNYGLRWNFSSPIKNSNNIDFAPNFANFLGPSTNWFQPGTLNGVQNPVFTQTSNTYGSNFKQPAPNLGIVWNPKYDNGIAGKLLSNKTVFRASYAVNFYEEGLNAISNVMSANPGATASISLLPGQPGFAAGALTAGGIIPSLSTFPTAFNSTLNQSLFTFNRSAATTNPNLRIPYVQNWTLGIQRQIANGLVIEARYVGNKSTHVWHYSNVQETNIFENGFLQEFKIAQGNLTVNQANGKGASFANNGLPGQAALPILETAFGARGAQPALPATFTNGTFVTYLQQGQAGAFANSLATNINYICRMVGSTFSPCATNGYNVAGSYPINFFRVNPYVNNLNYQDSNGNTNYNGLQLEVRKVISHGLAFQANYTWSHTLGNIFNASDQTGTSQIRTLRNGKLDYGPTPFDLRQVFQSFWSYSLPVGKGKLVNLSNPVVDRIAGGWVLSGVHRLTSGRVFQLTNGAGNRQTVNNLTDSGIVLNGLTVAQLQSKFARFSSGPNKNLIETSGDLIGPDGRANPQFLVSPTTPGVFGSFVYLYGPKILVNDLAVTKEVRIRERARFGFQVEALNVFNHPVFAIANANIQATTFGQTTTAAVSPRNIQLRAYFQF